MSKFLNQLYREHRMIAAVLHGMQYLIDTDREKGTRVDPGDYEKLFSRIVNLAPPPIGVGPIA